MNWTRFISEHPGRLFFPRIGRSVYNNAGSAEETRTLANWLRETNSRIHVNN